MSIEEVKEKIKEAPISSIIGEYIELVHKGANAFAVCPFHDDHKPSLSVHDGKGMFRCFVCETSGDAIKFVGLYKHLDFIESLKEIAKFLGIDESLFDSKVKKNPRLSCAEKLAAAAAKLYFKLAQSGSISEYNNFLEERKIDKATADKFQVGFAPLNCSLCDYIMTISPEEKRNFAVEVALEIGLIRKNPKNGQMYDSFRQRVIFPIWNHAGIVVGFSSRAVHDYQMKRKYVNSSDSILFHKKDILYGLNFAKSTIRQLKQLILVEGQMDVIALYRQGFHNVVATSGTTLDEKMIALIKSRTENVILALDSDPAGFSAMERIHKVFLKYKLLPRYLDFSPHKDADEFLKEIGRLSLIEKIEEAPLFLDTLVERDMPETIPKTIDRKLACLKMVYAHVAPLGEHILANEKIIQMASSLGLKSDSTQILDNYRQFLLSGSKTAPKGQVVAHDLQEFEMGQEVEDHPALLTTRSVEGGAPKRLSPFQKKVIRSAVENPEVLASEEFIELLDFAGHNGVKKYFLQLKLIYDGSATCGYLDTLRDNAAQGESATQINEVVNQGINCFRPNSGEEKDDQKKVKRLIFDLKKEYNLQQLKSKREIIKESHRGCDDPLEVANLMAKHRDILKEIDQLKNTTF